MGRIVLLAAVVVMPCLVSPCTFQFDPAAHVKYYRSEGWQLPGLADVNSSATGRYVGFYPQVTNIPGARALALPSERDHVIDFPAQTFMFDGALKRMRPALMVSAIVRWEVNGRIFAYSYGLIPVSAHRTKSKWKIDSMAACIFDATFIDENGDGVFRLLVPQALTESLVPAWVKLPQG